MKSGRIINGGWRYNKRARTDDLISLADIGELRATTRGDKFVTKTPCSALCSFLVHAKNPGSPESNANRFQYRLHSSSVSMAGEFR